jgi:hypothetical protein
MFDSEKPYYIAFRVPGAKGIELRNHPCSIHTQKILSDNVKEVIIQLDYKLHSKTIDEIEFPIPRTDEEILQFIETYNGRLVPDICNHDPPMLFLDSSDIEGELDDRFDNWRQYEAYKAKRVRKFLAFFGIKPEPDETNN